MSGAKQKRELDLSGFPRGSVTEFTTLVCLACIFDIFTKQLGLAPRTAFSEIKRHTPTVEELTSRQTMRPYFDSDEKNPHCHYCGAAIVTVRIFLVAVEVGPHRLAAGQFFNRRRVSLDF